MGNFQTGIETRMGAFQIAILFLSVLVLCALGADTFWTLPGELHDLIQLFDFFVCIVLLADFLIRLHRAESKLQFMKWGWIDLVASIPNLDLFRWGRLVNILRIIRLLRGLRSVHRLLTMVFENNLRGSVASLLFMAFLLVTFSSFSILVCERSDNSNIKSAEDAIWWSMTTITTVGYGDKYPVTTEGRIIGIFLMICGVGMFGGLSGMIASYFLGSRTEEPTETKKILDRLEKMEATLNSLQRKGADGSMDDQSPKAG